MEKLITVVDPYTLTEKVQPNTSYPIDQFLEERVPKGWRPLVHQLVLDLFDLNWDGQIIQIKEKLGGLRFYPGHFENKAMFDRIRRAEKDSFNFCETCGNPGFLCRLEDGVLLKTLCNAHLVNRSGSFERVSTTTIKEGAKDDSIGDTTEQHGKS